MPYTEWIDQCCSLLEAKNECTPDASVRSLIETRNLGHRVKETFSYDISTDSTRNTRNDDVQLENNGEL